MSNNQRPRPILFTSLLLLLALALPATTLSQMSPEERDKAFAEKLVGARLEGKFNVSSGSGTSAAQADNYAVSELEKGEGDTWIFKYTMSYGQGPDGPKITVPIPVVVEWAGDTPVLTMTDQEVDGIGTFSVRVLIYKDWYAGTWDNGTLGGHMWGQIVKD